MGEAKKRGTYEQRKLAAVVRDKQRQAEQKAMSGKVGVVGATRNHKMFLASLLAIAAQSGYIVDLKN